MDVYIRENGSSSEWKKVIEKNNDTLYIPNNHEIHLGISSASEKSIKLLSENLKNDKRAVSLNLIFAAEYVNDNWLKHLCEIKQLTSISLIGCDRITDAGLVYISKLKKLRTLVLNSCRNITDYGIKQVSHLSNLTILGLDACDRITDKGLEYLSRLFNLKELHIRHCYRLTKTGKRKLKRTNSTLEIMDKMY